jgi:glycosyltransferase involved in cell wall biosynthesis
LSAAHGDGDELDTPMTQPSAPNGRLSIYLPGATIAPPRDPYGRLVANAGLFRALAKDGGYDQLHFQCGARTPAASDPSGTPSALAAELGISGAPSPVITVGPLFGTAAAAAAGTLLYGQPYLTEPAWARRSAGRDGDYSIVGSIFAFASAAHREQMLTSLLAPVHDWDALVCSSPTLRATVERTLDEWEDYLLARLGCTAGDQGARLPRPQLPVIPFGTDVSAVVAAADDGDARRSLRTELGIADDAVMVFHLARLSPYDKAFPQPMFRAVQAAQQRSGTEIHLVLTGWFPGGEDDRARYIEACAAYAPDVAVTILDGNDAAVVRRCWAAADVFLLLSDTILETFGQALVEAMAAGVPLVVSDWDGYRSIVREGVDGYLVPTLGAPGGPIGRTLALMDQLGLTNYSQYGGATAEHTAVDVPAAAAALAQLCVDPALRQRLGDAGRRRAREVFDWRVVVGQYQQLFDELAERRRAGADPHPCPRLSPLRDDPFRTFANLPTQVLTDDLRIRLAGGCPTDRRGAPDTALWRPQVALDDLFPGLRGSADEAQQVLDHLTEHGEAPVADVVALFPAGRRAFVRTSIVWLAKAGAIQWSGAREG